MLEAALLAALYRLGGGLPLAYGLRQRLPRRHTDRAECRGLPCRSSRSQLIERRKRSQRCEVGHHVLLFGSLASAAHVSGNADESNRCDLQLVASDRRAPAMDAKVAPNAQEINAAAQNILVRQSEQ
jgi:hypothetical protein